MITEFIECLLVGAALRLTSPEAKRASPRARAARRIVATRYGVRIPIRRIALARLLAEAA